jgi:hypothetical protein
MLLSLLFFSGSCSETEVSKQLYFEIASTMKTVLPFSGLFFLQIKLNGVFR